MALRKMKKSMKPLVMLIAVAFILTIVAAGIMGLGNKTPYAFKLNGKKVEIQEVDKALKRGIDSVTQQVGQGVLDEQELKVLFFDQVIEIQLLLQEADELKVKVSDADVNAEYEKIKTQFQTKEEFETWQQRTGYTKMTLTEDIKKQLILEKAKEAISKEAKVSDEEIKSYYEENKYNTYFAGKTFDSVKEELKKTLLQAKEGKVYRAWKEKKMAEVKLDFPKINKAENPYKALQRKVVYEKEGFKFTNVDFVNRGFSFTMQGVKDKATVDKMIKENIDKELKIVAKAKAANVKVDETLAQEDKMSSYVEEYQKYLIKTTKVSEEDCGGGKFPESESHGQAFISKLGLQGEWRQTSYNGNFRGSYAGQGYTFREDLDMFIMPQPYESWVINEENGKWEAPEPMPEGDNWIWDEEIVGWKQFEMES